MPSRPGDLRQRIIVQAPPASPAIRDAFGQPSRAPKVVGTYWASVEPVSGLEATFGQQVRSIATHKVTMRYPGDNVILTGQQILHRGRPLDIVEAIDRDERRQWLDILAKEQEATSNA